MLVQHMLANCCFAAAVALALAAQPQAAQARVLYSFNGGADGWGPNDLLGDADGNLYGTTGSGGDLGCDSGYGCGVVFKLAPDGTQTVLHAFHGDDGWSPSGLKRDAATGDFYGVTFYGGPACAQQGSYGCGLIYKLAADGTETVLHEFTGGDGGDAPVGLRRDSAGNIYGGAFGGTNNCGIVYQLTADGTFNILHAFAGTDGCGPSGHLIGDGLGNFYGTTQNGGTHCRRFDFGCGVLFKLAEDGTYTVLHDFKGGDDGKIPGSLVRDDTGNLYGTTVYGGGYRNCDPSVTCGVLYKLGLDGTFKTLHIFTGGDDGGLPGGLERRHSGKFYGRTYSGGGTGCGGNGCGTIFSLTRDGVLTTIHTFTSERGGTHPRHLLIENDDPHIYGVTASGGAHDAGTVFELK
jgi:uncharacterized repeat protein (TIGR03803 family)